jgi:hypothetical protein
MNTIEMVNRKAPITAKPTIKAYRSENRVNDNFVGLLPLDIKRNRLADLNLPAEVTEMYYLKEGSSGHAV